MLFTSLRRLTVGFAGVSVGLFMLHWMMRMMMMMMIKGLSLSLSLLLQDFNLFKSCIASRFSVGSTDPRSANSLPTWMHIWLLKVLFWHWCQQLCVKFQFELGILSVSHLLWVPKLPAGMWRTSLLMLLTKSLRLFGFWMAFLKCSQHYSQRSSTWPSLNF